MLAVVRPPSTTFVSGPTPKRTIVRHLASSSSLGVPWREPPPGALSLRQLQGQLTLEGLDLRYPASRTTFRSSLSSLFQNLASITPRQDGLPALPASTAHTVLKIVRSLALSKGYYSLAAIFCGGPVVPGTPASRHALLRREHLTTLPSSAAQGFELDSTRLRSRATKLSELNARTSLILQSARLHFASGSSAVCPLLEPNPRHPLGLLQPFESLALPTLDSLR